jgi:ADP-heptose:LPS heptosyltransferase
VPVARGVTRSGARRRLNRALYAALTRLYRTLFPSAAPTGRLPPTAVRRLLVVRHDAIGDMAVTLPALAYLRATLPHAEIDVTASVSNAPLVRGDPRVTCVLVHDGSRLGWWRLLRAVRARRYDVIVSAIHNPHLREGLFAALGAAPRTARVTAMRPKRYLGFFTHVIRVPHSHRRMAPRLLYLAAHAVGDGPAPHAVDVAAHPPMVAPHAEAVERVATFLRERVGAPFVALNAWGRDPARCFGPTLTAEIVAGLARRDPATPIVLTPPPGAVAEAEAVAAAVHGRGDLPSGARIVVAPAGSLGDLVELLRRAALVVTPDTANVHLASALGVPVVSVHTPLTADVAVWGPWHAAHRTVVLADRRPLRETSADDVVAAVDALRAGLAHG